MKRMLCVALSLVLVLATVPAYALDPATNDVTVGESEVEPLDKNPADDADNADSANETIDTEEYVPAESDNPNADDAATEKETAPEDAEAPRGSKRSESSASEASPNAILSEDPAPTAENGTMAPADLPFVIVDEDGNPAVFDSDYHVDDTSLVVTGRNDGSGRYWEYTISMAEGVDQTGWNIVVEGDAPYVNLKNVSIKTDNVRGALVQTGAQETCEVWFEGENHLECTKGAGVYVDNGGSIDLYGMNEDGTDRLVAIGSTGCPGIGVVDTAIRSVEGANGQEASADLACGGISIDNLQVEAQGGLGAAGIGCGMTVDSSLAEGIFITGSLVRATGGEGGAGIGGGLAGDSSAIDDIRIYSSDVTATGGEGGAGIGSGFAEALVAARSYGVTADDEPDAEASCASHIEIYSSDVTAIGGNGGAGIGSGGAECSSSATGIQIHSGSDVETTGKDGGAGIGSGCTNNGNSEADQISVEDARVLATSATSEGSHLGGAGIGAGAASGHSLLWQVAFKQATVHAEGGEGGAGIGAGTSKTESIAHEIRTQDSAVTAIGGTSSPGIGGGATVSDGQTKSALDFFEMAGGTLEATGDAGFPGIGTGAARERTAETIKFNAAAGRCFNVWEGASADTAQLVKNRQSKTWKPLATELQGAYVKVEAVRPLALKATGGASHCDEAGTLILEESAAYTVSMEEGVDVAGGGIAVAAGASPSIVLDNVKLDATGEGRPALLIPDGAGEVTLALSGCSALASAAGFAGIQKDKGSGTLTITDSGNSRSSGGELKVKGGFGGAGIGAGRAKTGNSETDGIVIKGGTVIAEGGYGAAGIGSGLASEGDSIAANLSFEGGSVTASTSSSSGFARSSGIGSGSGLNSTADGISISEGTVSIMPPTDGTPFYAAGIGSGALLAAGDTSAARNIRISGGDVTVDWNGAYAPAIGSGGGAGENGKSEARGITISGGRVDAQGACGGIGSGVGATQSLADGISISGGTVTAAATNGHYRYSAVGSGLVTKWDGTSTTNNVCISGGDVTAWTTGGGAAFGPKQQEDGDEPYSTTFSSSTVEPEPGFCVNGWKGATAETAEMFLENESFKYLMGINDSYMRLAFLEVPHDVWVSGVQVTPSNAGDVLGDGTVSFSPNVEEGLLPATGQTPVGTLTLNGANLKGIEGENDGAGIFASGPLVVVLAAGSANAVDGAFAGEDSDSVAVSVSQALAIAGSGSLDAQAARVEGDGSSVGISCEASYGEREKALHGGYLLITDSAHVYATGGSAEHAAEQCASMGIASYSQLIVEKDATLAARGGIAAAQAGSMGAFGTQVVLRDNATLTGVGDAGGMSVGVGCTGFQATGGTLVAQSDPTATTQHAAVIGAMDVASYADYSWRTAPDGAYMHLGFAQPEQTDYLEIAPGNLAGGPSTDNASGTTTKALAATGDGAIPVVAALGALAILAGSTLAIARRRQRCTVSETKRRLYHE